MGPWEAGRSQTELAAEGLAVQEAGGPGGETVEELTWGQSWVRGWRAARMGLGPELGTRKEGVREVWTPRPVGF